MREGVDKDDRYRMVEDEFLAVAHDFTRHIHAAEYQRLKGLAKSQNEETIQNISRPVTGEMTEMVKRRHAALDTATRQRRVLGKRSADGDEPRGGGGSSLQGLMESPRKQAVPLTSFGGSNLARAARGRSPSRRRKEPCVEPSSSSSEDEDDGLDGGPSDWLARRLRARKPDTPTKQPEIPFTREVEVPARKSDVPTKNSEIPPSHPAKTSHAGTTKRPEIQQDGDPDDDENPFSRIRSRRARRSLGVVSKGKTPEVKTEKASDSQKDRDAVSLDEIPWFL